MKRICAVLLFVLTILVMTSCGKKIEVEYYDKTEIPTFTCVTGIEADQISDETGFSWYRYYMEDDKYEDAKLIGEYEELMNKKLKEYVRFLKKNGFKELSTEQLDMSFTVGGIPFENTIAKKYYDLNGTAVDFCYYLEGDNGQFIQIYNSYYPEELYYLGLLIWPYHID